MILIIPTSNPKLDLVIEVKERRADIMLTLTDETGIPSKVILQLAETQALADLLRKIARRVATRPPVRP